MRREGDHEAQCALARFGHVASGIQGSTQNEKQAEARRDGLADVDGEQPNSGDEHNKLFKRILLNTEPAFKNGVSGCGGRVHFILGSGRAGGSSENHVLDQGQQYDDGDEFHCMSPVENSVLAGLWSALGESLSRLPDLLLSCCARPSRALGLLWFCSGGIVPSFDSAG